MTLTHLSLFSGIGGIDISSEWAGFKTVGQCELDKYATKVLEKNFPGVPRWEDIRDVTAESFREKTGLERPTLISGGFPCQPHSLAGKRKASADERDLWGEVVRVLREIKPRWFLGENVRGLLTSESGRFFGGVLRDLSDLGYSVGWCCYGASDVGANHRRQRAFIIAYANGVRLEYMCEKPNRARKHNIQEQFEGICAPIPNAHGTKRARLPGRAESEISVTGSDSRNVSDPNNRRGVMRRDIKCGLGGVDDGISAGMDGSVSPFDNWIEEPDIPRLIQGQENRKSRLKCLGNAVVPQQVYPILAMIAKIEREATKGKS